ncbi:MAG: hypothetical protein RL141_699 [Candidatus Parcubacteria bacterium]|jgi:hypothetical protein
MESSPRFSSLRRAAAWTAAFFESLPMRARQEWKIVLASVVGLMMLSVAMLVYALQDRTPTDAAVSGEEETVVLENQHERALDGVLVHVSSTHLLPVGVMVENSTDAWPLQGPAKAQLVFEAPVEGSITRFFLVFDASSTVAEIGPVRSARPYYVEWANGLDALYAHVGGSPDALDLVGSFEGFRDLNEFFNGWAFWRSPSRIAPHNVMTRMDLLLQAAERKKFTAGSFEPWTYGDAPTSTEVTVGNIVVPYQGAYGARWVYDAATGLYTRHYATGGIVRDADGTPVTATNVVILRTDATVLDGVGRLKLRTTGTGSAQVFTRGGMRTVEWTRTQGSHMQFAGVDGTDVLFSRGTTWISAVTDGDAFAAE